MNITNRINRLFLIVPFSLLMVTLNILRIFRVSITIDETGYHKEESYWNLMYESYPTANNHILHSLIRKFFVETFNDSLFFLRVDSLIAQIVFLFMVYKLCRLSFKNDYWLVCSFMMFSLVSPFVFDFWGLSRGYALGIACMVSSIYCYLKYIETKKLSLLFWAYFGALLSVYSNFSLINYYGALIAVTLVQFFLFNRKDTIKGNLLREIAVVVLVTVLLSVLITSPLIMVMKGNEMRFLGTTGFIENTIASVVKLTISDGNDTIKLNSIIGTIIGAPILLGILWLIAMLRKEHFKKNSIEIKRGVTLVLLILIPSLGMVAQFHWLGINYLGDRAATFLAILFIIQLVYGVYFFTRKHKYISYSMVSALLIALAYNFFGDFNTSIAKLWWFNAPDLPVFRKMIRDNPDKNRKLKVSVSALFLGSTTYDIKHHFASLIELPIDFSNIQPNDTTFDYYYILQGDTAKLSPIYKLDSSLAYGDVVLYKKNQ